ncbi:MAG: molybdopterin-dependent oxidoreductase [Clostridiales bacterium]|nr:molybdopterin-dependent oxidoreductase [Clostridiales bacterium]
MTKKIKTACRACHGGCGAIVTVEDDRVVKVEPDPNAPLSKGRMCPKGLAAADVLYDPHRLKYPLKRAGERGEGRWERISWDEAYNTIIGEIEKIKREHGIESVGLVQGTGRHHFNHMPRFAHTLGTPNWFEPGTAQCYFPRILNFNITYGKPLVVDYFGETNPECILVWGTNPLVTGADGEIQFLVRDAISKGSKFIVVDPRKTELAERAEVWLQVRPGTDAALALGMLNVIINEELYDKEFVEKWVHGFEALRERVQDYPPDCVADITWVPPEEIVRAARLYASSSPAALEVGCAIEHNPNCFDIVRAVSFLPGLCGNFDIPGGYIEGSDILPDIENRLEYIEPEVAKKRLGGGDFPFLSGADMPFPSAHIPAAFEAIRTGKPYPLKALLLFGNNGLMSFADSNKTFETLQKVDFLCCMDLYMTPTAELCDIVLPAASSLELDAVFSVPYFANYAVLAQKKITRLYERKSDEEVFFELCERMGLDYGGERLHDVFDWQLRAVGEKYDEYKGLDFERMCELSYFAIPPEYRQYEKRGGLRTPTGKMEVWSTVLEERGYDPLPKFIEPPETPYSAPETYKDYPLILLTGGRVPFFFHTEGRGVPSLRGKAPYPRVEIHPQTAAAYGIADGDWVYIESPRGRITQKALVTDGIDPRVVNCQHGWWYPEAETPDHGWRESNANILTSADPPYDSVLGTYQLRALLCRIYKNDDISIEARFEKSEIMKGD